MSSSDTLLQCSPHDQLFTWDASQYAAPAKWSMRFACDKLKDALPLSSGTAHAPSGNMDCVCMQCEFGAMDAQHDAGDSCDLALSNLSHLPVNISHEHPRYAFSLSSPMQLLGVVMLPHSDH